MFLFYLYIKLNKPTKIENITTNKIISDLDRGNAPGSMKLHIGSGGGFRIILGCIILVWSKGRQPVRGGGRTKCSIGFALGGNLVITFLAQAFIE